MTIGQTLFGFKGRIGRLTYLGYVGLDYAVSLLLIYLGVVVRNPATPLVCWFCSPRVARG